jgi:hypothetical protein
MAAFRLFARFLAGTIRGGLRLLPPSSCSIARRSRRRRSLGPGARVGGGAVALQIPGHPDVRRDVRQSEVLHKLNKVAPPHDILLVQKHLARIVSDLHK